MTFSEFQKKIIKGMLQYEPCERDIHFKDLLYNLFSSLFKKEKIFISPIGLEIETDDFSKTRRELIEMFYLIRTLQEQKVLFFIPVEPNPLIKKPSKELYFNTSSEEILANADFLKVNLTSKEIELICNNLGSDYYITSELYELAEMDFKTVEQKNLKYTLIALWVSIILSVAGFVFNWYITTSITKIEFNKPEQLKEISTTIIHLK